MIENLFLSVVTKSKDFEAKQLYEKILNDMNPIDILLLTNKEILSGLIKYDDLLNKLKNMLLNRDYVKGKRSYFLPVFLYLIEMNYYVNFTNNELYNIEQIYFTVNNNLRYCKVYILAIELLKYENALSMKMFKNVSFLFNVILILLRLINNRKDYDFFQISKKTDQTIMDYMTTVIKLINKITLKNDHNTNTFFDCMCNVSDNLYPNFIVFLKIYFVELLYLTKHNISLTKISKFTNFLIEKDYLNKLMTDVEINKNDMFVFYIGKYFTHIKLDEFIQVIKFCDKYDNTIIFDILYNQESQQFKLESDLLKNLFFLFNRFFDKLSKKYIDVCIIFIIKYQKCLIEFNIDKITTNNYTIQLISKCLKFMDYSELSRFEDHTIIKFSILANLNLTSDDHKNFFFEKVNKYNTNLIIPILSMIKIDYLNDDNLTPQVKFLYLLYNDITTITDEQINKIVSGCVINLVIEQLNNSAHILSNLNISKSSKYLPNKQSIERIVNLHPILLDNLINYQIQIINKNTDDIIQNINKKRSIDDIIDFKNVYTNKYVCKICFERKISKIFDCKHFVCEICSEKIINKCPFCRKESVCKDMFLE